MRARDFSSDDALDRSINNVGDVFDKSFNQSDIAEAEQNQLLQKLESIWATIRKREDSYSSNRLKLYKIQEDLEKTKNNFDDDFRNNDKELEEELIEVIGKQNSLNDEWYFMNQKREMIQEASKSTRAKLTEMNALEIKYRQQYLAAGQIIDKIRLSSNENELPPLKAQIYAMKEKIGEVDKDIDDLNERINDLETKSTNRMGEIDRMKDKSETTEQKIEAKKINFRSERITKKKKFSLMKTSKENDENLKDTLRKEEKKAIDKNATLTTMIDNCNALFNGKLEEAKITNSSILAKKRQLEEFKKDKNVYLDKINKMKNMKEEKQSNLEKQIEKTKKEKKQILEETKEEKENCLACDKKAQKIEEKNSKVTGKIGQCIMEGSTLEKIAKRIEKRTICFDKVLNKRNQSLEKMIETLNNIHSKISFAKQESEMLSRKNAIVFSPYLFERNEVEEVRKELKKQRKINRCIAKAIVACEENIKRTGAETIITKTKCEQVAETNAEVMKVIKLKKEIEKLEVEVKEKKLKKMEKELCNIFNEIVEEKKNWRYVSNDRSVELLCLWSEQIRQKLSNYK